MLVRLPNLSFYSPSTANVVEILRRHALLQFTESAERFADASGSRKQRADIFPRSFSRSAEQASLASESTSQSSESFSRLPEGDSRFLKSNARTTESSYPQLEGASRQLEGISRKLEGTSRQLEGASRKLEGTSLLTKEPSFYLQLNSRTTSSRALYVEYSEKPPFLTLQPSTIPQK